MRSLKRKRVPGRGLDGLRQREVGDIAPRNFEHLVAASEDLVLKLGIHRKLEKHGGCVNTLSFNADGSIIVTGSDDRTVILWDWDAGLIKLEFESGHSRNVLQAQMMPCTNDRALVTCGADGEVRHAQVLEGGQVNTQVLSQHEGRAHKIAVEPGSPHTFYTCGEDGLLQHFDLRTKSAAKLFICNSFRDRSDYMPVISLYTIAIDPRNPNLFAIGGSDEYARVYDIRKYGLDGSTNSGHPTDCFCPVHLIGDRQVGISGLAFSDISELLVSYNDELIYLFSKDQGLGPKPVDKYLNCTVEGNVEDSNAKHEPQVYRGHQNRDTLKGVRFFGPKCEYVASGSDCGSIFIWRKRDGRLLRVIEGGKCVVNCVEPHPHETVLASSGVENDVKIWTPTAFEPPSPVNVGEFRMPDRLDYCVIAPYDGDEDDIDGVDCDDNYDDS
ncbi:uncharacterized protein A4U43_C10F2360 [Asparagus officinalis]|uniref:Uncharacterized protein n=1 Tax=Asparagus officinalis TaxID=4686 RepID=A0A5P1E399_ASPOF|nr:DDB1- and CUL4-associated factor 8-like [Asparagus officinalis]ONK55925.1 uncharacterized protein A4U43_C10F2360 [Asparagus officinalis]